MPQKSVVLKANNQSNIEQLDMCSVRLRHKIKLPDVDPL